MWHLSDLSRQSRAANTLAPRLLGHETDGVHMEHSAADSSDLSMKAAAHVRPALTLLLLACMGLPIPATAQSPTVRAPLNTEQVVQNLVRRNAERAQQLRAYQGKRIYRLEYHGFPGARNAEMVVDVKFQ